MTVLIAGEIGRFDNLDNVNDSDDFCLLRNGVLYRLTAEVLAAYIVAENTTTKEITFADSPYTITALDDYISVDASGGAVTINLLPLATAPIKPISIKKIDVSANTVTIDGNSGETIDGSATEVISSQYNAVTVVPFSSEWRLY